MEVSMYIILCKRASGKTLKWIQPSRLLRCQLPRQRFFIFSPGFVA